MPSVVWEHFKKVLDKATCECGYVLKYCGGTSSLKDHLLSSRHKKAMEKKDNGPSAPKKIKLERPIATLFSPNHMKQLNQQLCSDVTDLIVEHNLPFSFTESPFLRRLIKGNYGQTKIPTRHDVSAEVPLKSRRCVDRLQVFVKDQKISLTLDEFSHKEHSLLCITGSYLTKEFIFQSKVLAVESFLEKHTGEKIALKINLILETLEVDKTNVVAATRDGAPNLAGSSGGACVKANIQSFHCFCHVLHLVVWDGINKTTLVSSVVEKASKIGIGFHRTPTAMAAYRQQQGQDSTTLSLQVKTRWNSTMEMLASVLAHKSNLLQYAEKNPGCMVSKHIKNMSEDDFDEITDVIEVLKPFEASTKMASYQNAPISCYPFFVRKLLEHLDNVFGEFAVNMSISLEARTRDLLNQSELGYAAFLDPRLCYKTSVMPKYKWDCIKKEVIHLLSKNAPHSADISQLILSQQTKNDLWEEDEEVVDNSLDGNLFVEEIERYINEKKLPLPRPDFAGHEEMYEWWAQNSRRFPNLAVLARKYLLISLSSVASERCFSKASLLFANSLRSRLSKQTAANLLIIKANLADEVLKAVSEKNEEEPEEIRNLLLENDT